MLDQNTDRMWYVIGAIIVGGLILTSSIVLFTDVAFASVVDSIALFSETGIHSENILTIDNIEFRGATSNLGVEGDLSEFNIDISANKYGGLNIDHKRVHFKPNTDYILSYEYEKVSGSLLSFGGHINQGFENNSSQALYVNGDYRFDNYHNYDSVYIDDSTNRQSVEVHFTTVSEFKEGVENYFWIQPNRGLTESVNLNIYNLKLVEVIN